MLSPDQLNQLLEQVRMHIMAGGLQLPRQVQAETPPGLYQKRRRLDLRYFRQERFAGKQDEWEDFSFTFKRTCRSLEPDVFSVMSEIEDKGEDKVRAVEDDVDHQQNSAELYDVLCQLVAGEALSIVKAVPDCEGYHAWFALHKKYNPKTLARGVRMMCQVVNPRKAKDLSEVESVINEWEDNLRKLRSRYNEELKRGMKIAILTNIMPEVVQDFIYTNITDTTEYEDLRERIRSLVSNKMTTTMGRVPMDVGLVGDGGEDGDAKCDADVDAMNSQRHRCGWLGAFCARMPEQRQRRRQGQGEGWWQRQGRKRRWTEG